MLDRHFTFIHIPKAGGTSTTEMLIKAVGEENVYPRERLFNYPLFTDVEPPTKPSLFVSHIGYSFFRGAGGYGMTIMRDPVERVLSLYSYWKNPGHGRPPGPPLPEGMSLDEFIESPRADIWMNIRNAQTWQIAFSLELATRQRLKDLMSFELYDIARTNILKLSVVGIIEEPENFFTQLKNILPEAQDTLFRRNASVERLSVDQVSDETISKIREYTNLDQRLYDFVKSEAASRASLLKEGARFRQMEAELERDRRNFFLHGLAANDLA